MRKRQQRETEGQSELYTANETTKRDISIIQNVRAYIVVVDTSYVLPFQKLKR